MSIIVGNAPVPGNSTVAVFVLPTGLSNFCVYQPTTGSPATVYVGTSPSVSKTNGLPVPISPSNTESYNSTGGGQLVYATTGSAAASSFQYIISTAN